MRAGFLRRRRACAAGLCHFKWEGWTAKGA
jgi:hypothetical protein